MRGEFLKAEIEALGSQLLDVQQDCIKLRAENKELRACHEAELGVCFQHCEEVKQLQAESKMCYARIKKIGDESTKRLGEILKLQAENEALKGLLKTAICPNAMNGCQNGKMPNPIGEIEQCQWCYEREQALRTER